MPSLGFDFNPFQSEFGEPLPADPFAGSGRRPRPEYRQPLPAAESRSVGDTLLSGTSSLLQYGASTLDKPGQAVRGLLAGKGIGSLKHLVPFAESAGLTKPADFTSGRDLTNQIGLTRRNDRGWGAFGLGLGAEIVTDPTTYLTLGAKHALTPAGLAAKKLGTLKGLSREQILNQGLGGLAGLGLPFQRPAAVLGTGPAAQAVARGLDKTGEFLKYGNPLGRSLNAKFDPNVNGAIGKLTQKGWAQYGTPALDEARRVARGDVYNLTAALDPIIKRGAAPETQILADVRRAAEGVPGPFAPAVQAAGDLLHGPQARILAEARALGLPVRDAADKYAQYGHRQGLDIEQAAKAFAKPGSQGPHIRSANNYPVFTGSNIHRDDLYRNVPGATEAINDWAVRFAGSKGPLVARTLKKEMVATLLAGGGKITRPIGKALDEKAAGLARDFAARSPDHTTLGLGIFSPNVVADLARRSEQHARTAAAAQAVYGTLGNAARRIGPVPSPDVIPIPRVLRALGLTTRGGTKTPIEGALVQAYNRLRGPGAADPFVAAGKLGKLRKAAARYGITRDQFREIAQAHAGWKAPEEVKDVVHLWDNITNTFKNLTYPIWIPSHVRNALSAAGNHAIEGVGGAAHAAQLRLMRDTATAAELARFVPDLPPGLTDDAARTWVRGQQFQDAKIYNAHNAATDQAGAVAKIAGGNRITPDLPGSGRRGTTGSLLGDIAHLVGVEGVGGQGKAILNKIRHPIKGANPFEQSQVWGGTKDFPALAAGRIGGTNIEDFFRGAQYLDRRAKGFAGPVAGADVNRVHFDYDALTPTEKNVMRRLVPFYTYARKNLPLQLGLLASRPGVTGTELRALASGRDQDGYVPGYLASTGAVPLGAEQDGKQRYLSSFGTPIEEALERFKFQGGRPDFQGTALAFAGALNPLIKGPLEQATDLQFHTGRHLSDLKAPRSVAALTRLVGEDNPQLLSQVLANTPATRFLSATDKAIDERKPWWAKAANLLTGVKVTDVDVDQQRAIETKRAADDLLRRSPHVSSYTNFYVKPEQAGALTPAEVQLLREEAGLQQAARAHAKAQRIGIRPR